MAPDVEGPSLFTEEPSPSTAEETVPETTAETVPATEPETVPETIPETVPVTEPETVPETIPETAPVTEPETLLEAETVHQVEETAVFYDRTAAAQISYPDQKEEQTNDSGMFGALWAIFSAETGEEPSLTEQIAPAKLRAQVLYEDVFPGVDFQYELYSYNIKETIIVKEPLSGYSFSFRLNLVGFTPVLKMALLCCWTRRKTPSTIFRHPI